MIISYTILFYLRTYAQKNFIHFYFLEQQIYCLSYLPLFHAHKGFIDSLYCTNNLNND